MDADNAVLVCRKCGAKYSASQDRLHDRQLCGRCNAPLLASERKIVVLDVSDIDFAREVLASPEPVLLMIWAPWCAYCRMLHPIIDRIASEYNDRLKVARLNVDDNPAVCSQYTVQGVPTILMFKDGKLMNRMVGVLSKEDIEREMKVVLRVNSGDVILDT
ncbi:thiol reductase thioredoxin [bacterium]|nr:MAG: thiol reductase thioredoxin [bacterium]